MERIAVEEVKESPKQDSLVPKSPHSPSEIHRFRISIGCIGFIDDFDPIVIGINAQRFDCGPEVQTHTDAV